MNFKLLFSFVLSILCVNLAAQDFVAELYFEDSQGRRDTLTYGFNGFATIDIDEELGEEDISDQALDSLDVRAFRIETPLNHPPFVHGDCDHQDFDLFMCQEFYGYEPDRFGLMHETKTTFEGGSNCASDQPSVFNVEFFIPVNASYPIRITWDSTLFIDTCRSNSHLSEIPPMLRGDLEWCNERIMYPIISFVDSSSVTLMQPNFLTLARKDSSLVSVYYISLTMSGALPPLNTNELDVIPFDIYPNPSSDILRHDLLGEFSYNILDQRGREMLSGKNEKEIDIHHLSSGVYFLQIEQDGQLYQAQKFVKL